MEKFTARKCYKLGAVFACFKSQRALLTVEQTFSHSSSQALLSLPTPELPPCSSSKHTLKSHQLQSSSIWSQAFLSMDYFKQVFNTTAESLSQQAGCHIPTGLCFPTLLLSQMGRRKKLSRTPCQRGMKKLGFPIKRWDIFLGGRAASSRGHRLELLHPVAPLVLRDDGAPIAHTAGSKCSCQSLPCPSPQLG